MSSISSFADLGVSKTSIVNPGHDNTSAGYICNILGFPNREDRDRINEYVGSLWRRYGFDPDKAYDKLPRDLVEKAEEELQRWLEEISPEAGRCRPWLASWFLHRQHTKPPIANLGHSNTTAKYVFDILGLPDRKDKKEINEYVNSLWKCYEFDLNKAYSELPEDRLEQAKEELQTWLEKSNSEAERCPWLAGWFLFKRHRARRPPKTNSSS